MARRANSHLTAASVATSASAEPNSAEVSRGLLLIILSVQGAEDVAKPELGMKRQCLSCSTKFFDLNRDPITCPKCGSVFQAAASSRPAARAQATDDEAEDTGPVELVSLEDADAGESKDVAAATEGIEVEDDAADETFLEEEEDEGNDDVSGLIDGDIGDDEEA